MDEKNDQDRIPGLDFTRRAFDTFYDVVDDPYFRDQDLDVIYDSLKNRIQIVSFGDYLKRYIYEKAEMTGNYQDIPTAVYRDMICCEFQERQTPASFVPSTVRLKNLAKNWLEQKTVGRSTVLLLGFGLGMSEEDVNDFLTKALKEQRLFAKDPFEVVCWYCYRNRLGFLKFQELWNRYTSLGQKDIGIAVPLDSTGTFKSRMINITDENRLLAYLKELPAASGTTHQSVMARMQFDRIYADVREWVANTLNEMEQSNSDIHRERLRERLAGDDRYYDFEKREILNKQQEKTSEHRRDEIGTADVEQMVFAAIPRDRNGNLLPMKSSSLNLQFAGTRLSRQRLNEIISGKVQITRYDLITLNFLAFSQRIDQYDSVLKRYSDFIDSTNDILEKSNMGPIYPVNPYESFIMMCILTDDPVGTFSDVWELSYAENR